MEKLVTKEWLANKIASNPEVVIGRALVAIFNNQLSEEQNSNVTRFSNGIGFTQADARCGSISAKFYLKHGKLEEWQIKVWMKPNKHGLPRIVKYAEQLNKIANAKLVQS